MNFKTEKLEESDGRKPNSELVCVYDFKKGGFLSQNQPYLSILEPRIIIQKILFNFTH